VNFVLAYLFHESKQIITLSEKKQTTVRSKIRN
jgi:hypothetical protein